MANAHVRPAFWRKETGNLMTPIGGLTEFQLSFFKNLKVGDRLILYYNEQTEDGRRPEFTLDVYKKVGTNAQNN